MIKVCVFTTSKVFRAHFDKILDFLEEKDYWSKNLINIATKYTPLLQIPHRRVVLDWTRWRWRTHPWEEEAVCLLSIGSLQFKDSCFARVLVDHQLAVAGINLNITLTIKFPHISTPFKRGHTYTILVY